MLRKAIKQFNKHTMATAAVSGQKMAGCVKWFNMKTGFGFLTVVRGGGSGELKVGSEVFVHHSNVKVQEEQYRFLVQGEYVEFDVSERCKRSAFVPGDECDGHVWRQVDVRDAQ